MALLDKLKRLLTGTDVPEDTRRLFESARSAREILSGLDELLTVNEVESKELDAEIHKLEGLEQGEVVRIRSGQLSERQKRNALLYVQRLRKQMEAYERRQSIYHRNMNLHLNLISKIQDIEAMRLRGVDEGRIDQIIMTFEENLEKYNETMNAASVLEGTRVSGASTEEERTLRELERELIGPGEAPAPEAPRVEPRRVEERTVAAAAAASREADIERVVERELAGGGRELTQAERDAELDRLEKELLEE